MVGLMLLPVVARSILPPGVTRWTQLRSRRRVLLLLRQHPAALRVM